MQEMQAGNVDDVVELWNVQSNGSVLPDSSTVTDIGQELEWTRILCRSTSYDDLLHRRGGNVVIKDKPKWERTLSSMNLGRLKQKWPPTPTEMKAVAVRPRSNTDPSDWF